MLNHIGTQRIETDRLLLRQNVMTDAEAMYRNWETDPEVSKFWTWDPHTHIGETMALLDGMIAAYEKPDNYNWVIELKETSEAVGYIYLSDIDEVGESASIHYLLSRAYWNRGLMTEATCAVLAFAFERIGMKRIHTHHHIDNPASGRVMQKAGLRYLRTEYRQIPDCERISGDYCLYEITRC